MNIHARQEFILQVAAHATSEGLRFIVENPDEVIWGDFTDEMDRGCIYEWLGRFHPQTRSHPTPGIAFLELCDITQRSAIIDAWDSDATFRRNLIEAIRQELFYRDPSAHHPVAHRRRHSPRQSRDRHRGASRRD